MADAVRLERTITREYVYDLNGNLVKEVDPLGKASPIAGDRETVTTYDELNRVKTVSPGAPGTIGHQGTLLASQTTTTTYDGYGNVVDVLENRAAGNLRRRTTTQYDARNRPVAETRDAGVDGIGFNGLADATLDARILPGKPQAVDAKKGEPVRMKVTLTAGGNE